MKRLSFVIAMLLLSSCGIRVGPINKPPTPTGITTPSQVTVTRLSSIMGWPLPMIFTIDGVEIYGLWIGQSYSFTLEPGDYVFGYYLGFNQCRQFIHIERMPGQHIYLGPPCRIGSAG